MTILTTNWHWLWRLCALVTHSPLRNIEISEILRGLGWGVSNGLDNFVQPISEIVGLKCIAFDRVRHSRGESTYMVLGKRHVTQIRPDSWEIDHLPLEISWHSLRSRFVLTNNTINASSSLYCFDKKIKRYYWLKWDVFKLNFNTFAKCHLAGWYNSYEKIAWMLNCFRFNNITMIYQNIGRQYMYKLCYNIKDCFYTDFSWELIRLCSLFNVKIQIKQFYINLYYSTIATFLHKLYSVYFAQ